MAAGFWIRSVAWLVDLVILSLIGLAVQEVASPGFLISFAIGIAYTVGFWIAAAATPGKLMMKLRVVDEKGDPITIEKAILRYIGYWVSTLTFLIGFLMIAFRKDKRGLHDLIAGTQVIRIE